MSRLYCLAKRERSGHAGRRQPSDRLLALRREEAEASSNEAVTYKEFAKRIERMREENLAFLSRSKRAGKSSREGFESAHAAGHKCCAEISNRTIPTTNITPPKIIARRPISRYG